MSLTDFIKEPGVRDRLNNQFPNQGSRATSSLEADWQTQNYTLVGTAFDYLLRFWLQQNIPECHTRQWVAEDGLRVTLALYPEYTEDVQEAIARAEAALDEYLESGEMTRELIESSLDLARVDWVYRSTQPSENLGKYDEADIIDCIRLSEILDKSNALDASVAYLNPVFGVTSNLVGGADADVILDGTLIDVKATSNSSFKTEYWRQLVGYLVLADIHRTFQEEEIVESRDQQGLPEIESFGVYFARHGELATVSASEIYEKEDYPEFRSWFVRSAIDRYAPFEGSIDRSWFKRFV